MGYQPCKKNLDKYKKAMENPTYRINVENKNGFFALLKELYLDAQTFLIEKGDDNNDEHNSNSIQ